MTYEAWVIIGLTINTILGVVAVWQRHQTIRGLNGKTARQVKGTRQDCGLIDHDSGW